MDEEIMDMTTEEQLEPVNISIVKVDVDMDDEEPSIVTTETVETVAVEPVEEIEIEVDEAIGWAGGDNERHYSLLGRDDPNQHTIGAITGLREELDEIERIKTVYSDKFNVANYYEWEGAAYSDYGYFVSLAPNTSKIKICDCLDILGVSVYDAGFVGGQNQEAPRDNSYGLIVTSGLVDVRCELDVQVGDYVVSNAYGYAKKSASNYGYRVLAKENKDGTEYVVILLGVQADKTNAIGEDLGALEQRVEVNEKNIVSAINVANQAYNKSAESANVSEEALRNALKALLNSEYTAEDIERLQESMSSTAAIAAQARALAEGAVTSAESMRDTAVKEANEALTGTAKLREEFAGMEDQITDIDGRVVIVTQKTTENGRAISGIQSKADEESARIDLLTSWQSDTKTAMARIEQKADENGAYIKSTVSNMDKYSVGPYSQAYGFTLEQAQDVLEIGMIYVPTSHQNLEAGTDLHKEKYEYTDSDEVTQEYDREFTPGYLYQWDSVGWAGDGTGWKTIGESQSVVFTTETPTANNVIQYWYTDGEPSDDTYEPYTLYKWATYETKEKKENEDGEEVIASIEKYSWIPVATLAGNSQNRAVSQIRQNANSIAFEVTNPRGALAGMKVELEETSSKVNSVASWPTSEGTHNMAIFEQKADDNGAYMVLAAVRNVDGESKIEELGGARIVMSDDATLGSYIQLDADRVNFGDDVSITNTGDDVMNVADKFIVSRDGSVRLDGNITWGTNSSPTQVVYCSAYITKPANNTVWSSFPETSTTGWHKKFASGSDYYGSYTYDGGATWGEPVQIAGVNGQNGQDGKDGQNGQNGTNGDTIQVVYAYYAKSGSSAPTKPTNGSGTLPSGWSFNPVDATTSKPFVFISQCTVTNGTYGDWSSPTCWAKYGEDGNDANVTDVNVFNALTNNGTKFGCFTNVDGKLYINAQYIKSGTIESELTMTGRVVAKNIEASGGKIGAWNLGTAPMGSAYSGSLYTTSSDGSYGYVTFLRGISSPNNLVFGIKRSPVINDGWNAEDANEDVFYIRGSGSVYAKNIEITGGSIKMPCGDDKQVEIGTNGGLRVVDTLAAMFTGKYSCAQYSANIIRFGYSTSLNGSITNTNWFAYNFDSQDPRIEIYGTWEGNSSGVIVSDVNMKNSIEYLGVEYETLFDCLTSRRFRYNDGTSGRYHTGYVAQEVQSAIKTSGLSEKDFAALCTFKDGDKNEHMGLRYEEFVSLNTWQIQKLKARVAELEAKIATLV